MRWLLAVILMCGPVFAQVQVVDGDTFDLDGERIRVNGIDAPEAGQKCASARGANWACGTAATEALFAILSRGQVTCEALVQDNYGRTVANCEVAGRDVGEQMVRQGMAWAFVKFSQVYVVPQEAARAAELGIWQADTQTAWDYRAARWVVAEQEAPEGCPIKGNISGSGKIYHAPWSPYYSRTKITEAKGERWFCDEAEAVAAGWRAPYWR